MPVEFSVAAFRFGHTQIGGDVRAQPRAAAQARPHAAPRPHRRHGDARSSARCQGLEDRLGHVLRDRRGRPHRSRAGASTPSDRLSQNLPAAGFDPEGPARWPSSTSCGAALGLPSGQAVAAHMGTSRCLRSDFLRPEGAARPSGTTCSRRPRPGRVRGRAPRPHRGDDRGRSAGGPAGRRPRRGTSASPRRGGRSSLPPRRATSPWPTWSPTRPGGDRSGSKKPPPRRLVSMRVAPSSLAGRNPAMSETRKSARAPPRPARRPGGGRATGRHEGARQGAEGGQGGRGAAPCWRRSPRCRNRIGSWPSGST